MNPPIKIKAGNFHNVFIDYPVCLVLVTGHDLKSENVLATLMPKRAIYS
jgi:hypothetical protein